MKFTQEQIDIIKASADPGKELHTEAFKSFAEYISPVIKELLSSFHSTDFWARACELEQSKSKKRVDKPKKKLYVRGM